MLGSGNSQRDGLPTMEEPHEDPSRSDFYSLYIYCAYLRSSPTTRDRVVQREYFRRATVARRGIHSVSARQGKNTSSRKETRESQKFGVIKLAAADASRRAPAFPCRGSLFCGRKMLSISAINFRSRVPKRSCRRPVLAGFDP